MAKFKFYSSSFLQSTINHPGASLITNTRIFCFIQTLNSFLFSYLPKFIAKHTLYIVCVFVKGSRLVKKCSTIFSSINMAKYKFSAPLILQNMAKYKFSASLILRNMAKYKFSASLILGNMAKYKFSASLILGNMAKYKFSASLILGNMAKYKFSASLILQNAIEYTDNSGIRVLRQIKSK